MQMALYRQRNEGVPRGPGGPPHHSPRVVFRPCPGLRPLVRLGQEYCLAKSDPNPTAEIQVDIPTWLIAVRAAEAKQATDIKVLDLTGITSFADFFVICTGSNSKQIQAISDEVG